MTSRIIKKESGMVVIRAWREEEMGGCLMGKECQCCKMKKVLNICYTTMWLFLTLLNYKLENG